ncbi:MAG TPA: dTDP-4-dehydrorhamnose reductase [Acidimicrobiales bacterium]|nr:dTDP-4-dehydrorhamnose reductase [Acidimicrobiales bacterium]
MSAPLRVLVTGGNGQLGRDVRDVLAGAVPDGGVLPVERSPGDIEVLSTDIDNLDVVNRTAVGEAFESFRPEIVIHGGAFTAVDACESDPDTAFAVNAVGTRHVAEASRRVGAHLLYVSTDYVFDGTLDRPYVEWDATNPQSVYGRSKLGGEQEVAAVSGGDATVVRTAWVSGAHGANMVKTVLRLAGAGDGPLRFVDDQHGTPTFTADLATAIVGLALARRPGTFHVTNRGETTWFGFARATLAAAGLDPGRVEPITTQDLDPPRPAPRPANSRLDNAALRLSGLDLLPEWTASLGRLVEALPAVAERT